MWWTDGVPVSKPMRPEVEQARDAAQALRAQLGIAPIAPLPCAISLAEEHLGVGVVLAPLPGGCSGFYLPAQPRPVIVVESSQPVARQRFTLAHEIAHHHLGHGLAARVHDLLPAAHYEVRRSTHPDERAANTFAAELLAPEAGVPEVMAGWNDDDQLDLAVRLSAHYGLSALSAVIKFEFHALATSDEVGALKDRLRRGEHLPRYAALGLSPLDDALQRHADAGGGERASDATRATIARLRAEADALVAA